MNEYIEIQFQDISSAQSELLIAELSIIGFEGFEEAENILKAFIPASDFDEAVAKELATKNNLSFIQSIIKETNWNALWESNFQPVIVDDFVGIRAGFHEPVAGVDHEIVITPKMSFGTGHHATTFMMIQQMREINFTGKTVFDFGTGTGILAILSEKLGASKIIAVDYDEWSINNAEENFKRNKCSKYELKKTDSAAGDELCDIILANINRNVILDNFSLLLKRLSYSGILLVSGLLVKDEAAILTEANKCSLSLTKKIAKNNWISLRFNR